MSLRETAAADLDVILNDIDDWAVDIILTDPSGVSLSMRGFSMDIGVSVDAETGQLVSGRSASVSLPISDILMAGMVLPTGSTDTSSMPFVVTFDDTDGMSYRFEVVSTQPDRTLGLVVCALSVIAI